MASSPSIHRDILRIKHFHATSSQIVSREVRRYGELHEQQAILLHGHPYKRLQGLCPVCGRKCPGYDHKSKEESKWRAPSLNGLPVFICYRPQRVRCPEHGILTERIPWADGDSRFTEDFNNEVAWMVGQMPRSAIASYLDINWRTVGNCVRAAHARLEPDTGTRLRGLRRICVDETSRRKGHSYITVVYDMDRNRVVWVHKDHGRSVFEKFCQQLTREERSQIEVVAGDGAKWIDSCVEEYFPNAKRCMDSFHVTQWAMEALDGVRRDTARKAFREYRQRSIAFRKEAADAERKAREDALESLRAEIRQAEQELLARFPRRGRPSKEKREHMDSLAAARRRLKELEAACKAPAEVAETDLPPKQQAALQELDAMARAVRGAKHALGHNPENRTKNQDGCIKLIANSYPDLYHAHQLKEGLRLVLHLKDPELAAIKLDEWLSEARGSGLAPMESLAEKIASHRESILNAVACQANSSKSEATNTTIKALIKMARGFRNLSNMIALIYLKCSDLVVPLRNRIQRTAEQAAAMREKANAHRRAREEARRSRKAA